MDRVILGLGHPYVKQFNPSVFSGRTLTGEIIWMVKWRDFLVVKQDRSFSNHRDAAVFSLKIVAEAPIIDGDMLEQIEFHDETVKSLSDYWANLYNDRRSTRRSN